MIHTIKNIAHRLVPKSMFRWYHSLFTWLSAWWYGFPSRKLVIIAVTGTNGKSTTCILIADLLKSAGQKVGLASSVLFRVGNREWNNDSKMTMVGRGQLQALLAEMVKVGCTHAIIEASSEGLEQGRLSGTDVDVAVFTNLTPEHIESHGSFEKYKKAKGRLFASLARSYRKTISGKKVPKIILANTDDSNAEYYLDHIVDRRVGFGANKPKDEGLSAWYALSNIHTNRNGSTFELNQYSIQTGLEGLFNVYNSACAYAVVQELGFSIESLCGALTNVHGLPGRMEWIDQGQDYRVLVDYAPEPASLRALYDYLQKEYRGSNKPQGRIIHVLGSAGGGRDMARRSILGDMAGNFADVVIVTNEDPYDEDPDTIIKQVSAGALQAGKTKGENLFMIQDRKKAIFMACTMAKEGDIVLLTGKGAEQAIMIAGGVKMPWDEREIAREAIKRARETSE